MKSGFCWVIFRGLFTKNSKASIQSLESLKTGGLEVTVGIILHNT